MKGLDLTGVRKKIAKKAWPILEELDPSEYEVRNFELHCINCNGQAFTTAYKINSENEWKGYKKEVICNDCITREELLKSDSVYKSELNKKLTERYFHVPKGLENAGLKNYEAKNNVTKNALYACIQYVKSFNSQDSSSYYNLLMTGNPGTGKSHLSLAIAKTLIQKGFGSVGFITTGKLLAMIKETYQNGAARTENEILRDIEKLDFLVLDDLGAEAGNTNEFSWTKTQIFEIVNSRVGKPTVYTTNFDDKSISAAVGDRVSSRLQTNTKLINMFSEDYRKNFKID